MNRLLKRQIKQSFGKDFDTTTLNQATQAFIKRVSEAYADADKERKFLEHTIKINSDELTEAYETIEKHNFLLKDQIVDKQLIFKQYTEAIDSTYLVSKTDKRGVITYVNDKFIEVAGYSEEELVGQAHSIVRHRDMKPEIFKELWRTISSKKVWKGQIKNRAKDGSSYYVFATVFPLVDAKGEILEYIAIRNNITERVKGQNKLKKQQAYSKMLFDNQENIVFTANDRGVLEANKKFFDTFGFDSLTTFQKKHQCICELFIEKEGYLSATTPQKHWTEDIFKDPNRQHKALIQNRDGKELIFSVHLKRVEFDEGKFVIASFDDITEVEYARVMAEASEKAKSEFMANMSHEIRTPMNGIVGFTDLLFKSELTHKQRQFTEYLKNSTNILLKIVNDILDFSKIESGHLELDPTPTNPFVDLHDAMVIFKAQAKNKDISLIINFDSKINQCLQMDQLRIIQILTNLVNNALKFTPEQGSVEMSAMHISSTASTEKIRFSVQDTGIGIAEDRLESIFQSFIQADNSTTRNFGGTGLGLTISSSLCQLMKSQLTVSSELGRGSCFSFEVEFETCNANPSLSSQIIHAPVYVVESDSTMYEKIITQLQHFEIGAITKTFEDILYDEIDDDVILITFNYRQHKVLKNISTKVIIVDDSKEAFNLVKQEEISHHIGIYEESASTLYNAILDYNILPKNELIKNNLPISLNILVAEDYEINRILIEELFELHNITPSFAINGKEAVEKGASGEYDLIFMDINMPLMNGIDATKMLREKKITTPIIALTANALEGDKERYLKAGMNDYISKPIDTSLLHKLLNKYQKEIHPVNKQESNSLVENHTTTIDDAVASLLEAKEAMHFTTSIIIRLFNSFMPTALENIERLIQAEENKNMSDLYQSAHALRGISMSLKFNTIAELCNGLEYAAKEERDMDYQSTIKELQKLINALHENRDTIIERLEKRG